MRRLFAAAALLLLTLAVGCQGSDVAAEGQAGDEAAVGEDPAADAQVQSGPDDGETSASQDAQLPPLPTVPVSVTSTRVIKDGTIVLEVGAGQFDRGFDAVLAAAQRLGGSVVSTATQNDPEGPTSGTLTVRVPVDEYERLLAAMADVGEVRSRRVSAQDVTTEYVDLEARLRNAEAQERFYLGLLERAEDVQDAIAVQQRLASIQGEIERYKGRLQFLDDRTLFSTLTVELAEPGAVVLPDAGQQPSLAGWWAEARAAFVNVIGVLLVGVSALVPLLVPAGLILLAWRVTRQNLSRRPAAQSGAGGSGALRP